MTLEITPSNVQLNSSLVRLLNATQTEIDNIITLANELRTDHATNKTTIDAMRTAVVELMADHATFKTVCDDMKTLVNDIRGKLNGDYMLTSPRLAIGSTATAVSNVEFGYIINGAPYYKAINAAGTAPGNDVIPQSKYGAVSLQIGTDGTVDVVEATGNATGYDSSALAIAGLPALAADHASMGTVTATKSDGAFTFGTTELGAANTTVAYTNGYGPFTTIGPAVSTSSPATLSASSPAAGPATLTAAAVTATVTKGK